MLRQVEHLGAVGEERRAALREVQPPAVDVDKQRDELGRRGPLASRGGVGRRQ
jgi:hypothetical protein